MQREFPRSLEELANIVAFTEEFFAAHSIDESLRNVVDLCVEELYVNMVTYDTETSADILIEMEPHDLGAQGSITDFDVERFDPRAAKPVDVDAPAENREPGGLGLFLVLKMVDSINYEYRDRNSKITFVVGRK